MKFSYNWLKELIGTDLSAEEASGVLTTLGIEVASINRIEAPGGVVVVSVLTVDKHPNADKLSVCTVDCGDGVVQPVVCGAPNVRAGMKAALAPEGCVLGPDMTVRKVKIRGVESRGMLCSERELGLSDDHAGIMVLPDDAPVGRDLRQYFTPDKVIEIEITPNRGDCLSLLGVARELCAKLGVSLKNPARHPAESGERASESITVKIEDSAGCPRYLGRLVRGVKIGESPRWLKERLRASGLRPINNIVDITNYVLLLFGQPMHAFDYDTIAGRTIVVRKAEQGQKFVTLDGAERVLEAGDLMIWDGQRPVALAGIMGGADTEIRKGTTGVFLECAFFDPITIRGTSKRLGLSTDSSYRFERGVDLEAGLLGAVDTAAELMRELAGGTVAEGLIDEYPVRRKGTTIPLRPAQVERLLGVAIPAARIKAMLESLNIAMTGETEGTMHFTPPSYRHDLAIEADLVEEVGRLYGYDNIPTARWVSVAIGRPSKSAEAIRRAVRGALAGLGLHETVTGSMTSERSRALLTPGVAPVKLLNPLTPDLSQMRTNGLASLLEVAARNISHRCLTSHLFEVGKIFADSPGVALPREREVVSVLLQGDWRPAAWGNERQQVTFYALKGVLDALIARLGLGTMEYQLPGVPHAWYTQEAGTIRLGDLVTGVAGSLRDDVLKAFGVTGPACYAELDITELLARELPQPTYKPLPRFPAVVRDLCLVMPEGVPSSSVARDMREVSELVESVEPFDVYRGEKVGAGRKSIAYTIRLRTGDRTLSDGEADDVTRRIVDTMAARHGATLRA